MEGSVVVVFLAASFAAVLILRPLTKRLGLLLEAMARERRPAPQSSDANAARLVSSLQQVSSRLELLEERLDFMERLAATPTRTKIAARE